MADLSVTLENAQAAVVTCTDLVTESMADATAALSAIQPLGLGDTGYISPSPSAATGVQVIAVCQDRLDHLQLSVRVLALLPVARYPCRRVPTSTQRRLAALPDAQA
ncbi:hypothetical protein GGF41_007703 [Coemansia sp. RSA 2531]|nr:hypothetical protein GGF41_007703 [Coemansia sp. RSA 2531]